MSTIPLWSRLNPNASMGTQGAPSWNDLMSVYPLGDQARADDRMERDEEDMLWVGHTAQSARRPLGELNGNHHAGRQDIGKSAGKAGKSKSTTPKKATPSSANRAHRARTASAAAIVTQVSGHAAASGVSSPAFVPPQKILRVGTRVKAALHFHDWLDSWHSGNVELELRPLDGHYATHSKNPRSARKEKCARTVFLKAPSTSEGNRFITNSML